MTTRAFLISIISNSREREILDRFSKIVDDILGAYWMYADRIPIYWMPLAILAPLLNVPLSSLSITTLCHELVHAYSQRGVDIDGRGWKTPHFVNADTYVMEGIAQYYTEQVMRGLIARLPDGLGAFLALRSKQAQPYTEYQYWLQPNNKSTPEVVRLAMLRIRNLGPQPVQHVDLKKELEAAQAQLHGTPSTDL